MMVMKFRKESHLSERSHDYPKGVTLIRKESHSSERSHTHPKGLTSSFIHQMMLCHLPPSSGGRWHGGAKRPLRGQSLKDSASLSTSDWCWWWWLFDVFVILQSFRNDVGVGTADAGTNLSQNEVLFGGFINVFYCAFVVDRCSKTMRLKLLA